MGIQLSDLDRHMIRTIAKFGDDSIAITPYLFGYLTSRVNSFLSGDIDRDQLAEDAALVELLRIIGAKCNPAQLREIAAGTREVPGEDVQSVQ